MHEYSLMESVVEMIEEQMRENEVCAEAVKEIRLQVGALALHSVEAFQMAFMMKVAETPLEHARLIVEVIPARLDCEICDYSGEVQPGEVDPHEALMECPNCHNLNLVYGSCGVESIDLIVEEEPSHPHP